MSMAAEAQVAGDSIGAILNYVSPDTLISRRFCFPGDEVNTGKFLPYPVTVHNARLATHAPMLDTHGFELIRHHSTVEDFKDKAEIDAVYAREVMDAVRTLTGADLVVPIGYVTRTSADTSTGQAQPPASDVHVDIAPQTGPKMARALLERTAPGRSFRRFLVTSLWRTFSAPPQDWPLALCDHRSITPEEGVPNLRIVCDKRPAPAEMLAALPNEDDIPAALIFRFAPHHRWYYYPDMNRDEIVLIKLHDSDHTRAWFAPHTAFRDESRSDTKTRESIEFRTVAYFF
jgi:hypothetical protein